MHKGQRAKNGSDESRGLVRRASRLVSSRGVFGEHQARQALDVRGEQVEYVWLDWSHRLADVIANRFEEPGEYVDYQRKGACLPGLCLAYIGRDAVLGVVEPDCCVGKYDENRAGTLDALYRSGKPVYRGRAKVMDLGDCTIQRGRSEKGMHF